MKAPNIINKLFIISLVLTFVFSILRVGYNYSKIITEEINWINLDDDQKRTKTFGDIYSFIKFVESNTEEKSEIAFLAPGGKTFYLARYYLYPRKITYLKSQKNIDDVMNSHNYDYIIIYKTNDSNLNENNSLFWKIENIKPFREYFVPTDKQTEGLIYKL
ncbi:hypothetical protein C4577_05485 [Candidatus Parcubacteria bacterium]|nr:MAG: hypothetical protein C4577_05485 [Candidatus Parcubacteria bacterium]